VVASSSTRGAQAHVLPLIHGSACPSPHSWSSPCPSSLHRPRPLANPIHHHSSASAYGICFRCWSLFPPGSQIPTTVRRQVEHTPHLPSLTPLSMRYIGLPAPQVGSLSVSGGPQISEKKILGDAKTLSQTIGYRIVGTKEHARGDDWGVMKARELKRTCDSIITGARESNRNIRLECEWDRQQGSGTHR